MAAPIRIGVLSDTSESLPSEGQEAGILRFARLPVDDLVASGRIDRAVEYVHASGLGLPSGTAWAVDYPRGDRTFARLLERLTMIDVRAVEQPVNLDDDIDAYYWPFLISGLVGAWDLTDLQARKLREYLLRGGFLLCDSFYGTNEWLGFVQTMNRVFPDRPILELADDHPIFHAVYDMTDRPQVPTWQHLPHGYRNDGAKPHWRAILDDDERVMVMITFNNDIADGWQRADEFQYPAEAANAAIRLGVNFAVYALSH